MSRFAGFKGRSAAQYDDEFETLLAEIVIGEKVTRFLGIGLHQAIDFHAIVTRMPKDAVAVGVDYPADDPVIGPPAIEEAMADLVGQGYSPLYLSGDSHSPDIIEEVRKHGLYDFGFIDGDHTYDGSKADWLNYGPMCRIVAFHDIDSGMWVLGCASVWHEVKNAGPRYREIRGQYPGMGIGVVWRS